MLGRSSTEALLAMLGRSSTEALWSLVRWHFVFLGVSRWRPLTRVFCERWPQVLGLFAEICSRDQRIPSFPFLRVSADIRCVVGGFLAEERRRAEVPVWPRSARKCPVCSFDSNCIGYHWSGILVCPWSHSHCWELLWTFDMGVAGTT